MVHVHAAECQSDERENSVQSITPLEVNLGNVLSERSEKTNKYNFIYIKHPRIQNKQIYRHKIDYSFSRSRKGGKEGECLKAWVGMGGVIKAFGN